MYELEIKQITECIDSIVVGFTVSHSIGYGMTTDGVTTYINASTCNLKYQPFQNPIIFDLPNK